VWGVAGLIGPLLGGIIVKYLSWRWVFFINVPAGIAAAGLLVVALHENVEHRQHSLDWAGAALLTIGLTALLIGVHGGSATLVGLPVAVASMALFFYVEGRAPEPVLPLDLFRQRVMAVSTVAGALVGAGMISMITYVPLYVQGVLGGSPTEAGSAITPMVIGWPIASAISGRVLPRVGFKLLVRWGLAISAVAAVALAILLKPGASLHVPQAMSMAFGLGLGIANTALLIAVQTSVEWRQRGVATASTMFARTIGGTLAVGVLGALLSAALQHDGSLPADAADRLLGRDPLAVGGAGGGPRHGVLGDRRDLPGRRRHQPALPGPPDSHVLAGPDRSRPACRDEHRAARGLIRSGGGGIASKSQWAYSRVRPGRTPWMRPRSRPGRSGP
jgi:MFS family permease